MNSVFSQWFGGEEEVLDGALLKLPSLLCFCGCCCVGIQVLNSVLLVFIFSYFFRLVPGLDIYVFWMGYFYSLLVLCLCWYVVFCSEVVFGWLISDCIDYGSLLVCTNLQLFELHINKSLPFKKNCWRPKSLPNLKSIRGMG